MAWTRKYLQYSNRCLGPTTHPRRKTACFAQAANETYMHAHAANVPTASQTQAVSRCDEVISSLATYEALPIIYLLYSFTCVYTLYSIEHSTPKMLKSSQLAPCAPLIRQPSLYTPYVPRIYTFENVLVSFIFLPSVYVSKYTLQPSIPCTSFLTYVEHVCRISHFFPVDKVMIYTHIFIYFNFII